MTQSYLLIPNNNTHPIQLAIIICIAVAFSLDVELHHAPVIFFALVCFALFAGREGYTRHRRDGRYG